MTEQAKDPAEQYRVDVNVDTTPVGEESNDDAAVETVDEKVVETDDVTVTETHTETPSE